MAFVDDPKLVRGLDYYTRTTFEFVHSGLTGSQTAIGGGGRYDGLSEELGGPSAAVASAGPSAWTAPSWRWRPRAASCPAATSWTSSRCRSATRRGEVLFELVTTLRRAGVAADFAYGSKGIKAAMKAADRSGARYALVARRAGHRGEHHSDQGTGDR